LVRKLIENLADLPSLEDFDVHVEEPLGKHFHKLA